MKSTKIISLTLAVLLLCFAFSACKIKPDPSKGTTANSTTAPAETENLFDENGYLKDELNGVNLNNTTFNIAYWSDAEHQEFTAVEQTGDVVNDAIRQRNITVETRLNVVLNFMPIAGNTSNIKNFTDKITASTQAGDHAYQLIGTYSRTAASLSMSKQLQNMADLEYIDYEKPWWPDNLLKEATMNDNLFFVSGDISTNLLHMMYVTFFNKEMLQVYGLENPYDLVDSNDWTFEKMLQMCEEIYLDTSLDNQKDDKDTFGIMTSRLHVDAYYFAAGLRTVDRDENNNIVVSSSFCNERNEKVVETLGRYLHTLNDGFYTVKSSGVPAQTAMAEKRVLFIADRARTAFYDPVGSSDVKLGVVPMPKFDSAQSEYYTTIGQPFSLYCIPYDNVSPNEAAAVLECMASESYRTVTPALFEITMKTKYASDDQTSNMYDIIRNSTSFDLGRIYCDFVDNISLKIFRDAIANNDNALASKRATYVESFEAALANIVKIYKGEE